MHCYDNGKGGKKRSIIYPFYSINELRIYKRIGYKPHYFLGRLYIPRITLW